MQARQIGTVAALKQAIQRLGSYVDTLITATETRHAKEQQNTNFFANLFTGEPSELTQLKLFQERIRSLHHISDDEYEKQAVMLFTQPLNIETETDYRLGLTLFDALIKIASNENNIMFARMVTSFSSMLTPSEQDNPTLQAAYYRLKISCLPIEYHQNTQNKSTTSQLRINLAAQKEMLSISQQLDKAKARSNSSDDQATKTLANNFTNQLTNDFESLKKTLLSEYTDECEYLKVKETNNIDDLLTSADNAYESAKNMNIEFKERATLVYRAKQEYREAVTAIIKTISMLNLREEHARAVLNLDTYLIKIDLSLLGELQTNLKNQSQVVIGEYQAKLAKRNQQLTDTQKKLRLATRHNQALFIQNLLGSENISNALSEYQKASQGVREHIKSLTNMPSASLYKDELTDLQVFLSQLETSKDYLAIKQKVAGIEQAISSIEVPELTQDYLDHPEISEIIKLRGETKRLKDASITYANIHKEICAFETKISSLPKNGFSTLITEALAQEKLIFTKQGELSKNRSDELESIANILDNSIYLNLLTAFNTLTEQSQSTRSIAKGLIDFGPENSVAKITRGQGELGTLGKHISLCLDANATCMEKATSLSRSIFNYRQQIVASNSRDFKTLSTQLDQLKKSTDKLLKAHKSTRTAIQRFSGNIHTELGKSLEETVNSFDAKLKNYIQLRNKKYSLKDVFTFFNKDNDKFLRTNYIDELSDALKSYANGYLAQKDLIDWIDHGIKTFPPGRFSSKNEDENLRGILQSLKTAIEHQPLLSRPSQALC
jgi:hypothetical protein